ncbi:MAG TPA: DEAD/DEAH box helicase [Candidatus Nanoarchaeia archaeon]|nr:DEAD/DEAH box helicase [Candidatus Nanoarchaeia archaeon]
MKFEEFNLSNNLISAIKGLRLSTPTQVQELAIPLVMERKDVIAESATGSGKTLAFGCGIVDNVIPGNGLQALVLTPTRELAEQVKNMLASLAYNKHLRVIAVYGGVSINNQISELRRAEVVVATPGRLLDHLKRNTIHTERISILVLDEADRMFDMGFIDDVERIIRACPTNRQTLFFSATIKPVVKQLANKHMRNPVMASAQNMVDPDKLHQVYYNIQKNMKLSLLVHLLQHEQSGLVMVFCNTRRNTDYVAKNLKLNRISAIAIHGGLSQNKRSKTIDMFNGAKVQVLVCTDVAARGLHIEHVSHIYNYDLPKNPNDYIHRIGRTARAGEEGKVINLLCDFDYDNFSRILDDYRSFIIREEATPHLQRAIMTPNKRREFMMRRHNHRR